MIETAINKISSFIATGTYQDLRPIRRKHNHHDQDHSCVVIRPSFKEPCMIIRRVYIVRIFHLNVVLSKGAEDV